MQSLIEAVGLDLTYPYQPPDRNTLRNLHGLVSGYGSKRGAARALGVPESTLRGWLKGVTPKRDPQAIQTALRGLYADARGHYASAYRGDTLLTISGLIRVSKDVRVRTVHPGRVIPLAKIRNVLRAWRAGDDARAERLLYKAIDEHYQPLQFDNIIGAWFE